MPEKKNILIVLGCNYESPIMQAEQYLPLYLSRYYRIICFEQPQFLKSIRMLINGTPLLQKIKPGLSVFHAVAIFPFGRTISPFNSLNHLISFLFLAILRKNKYIFDIIISFTPEIAFLPKSLGRKLYYHVLDEYSALDWWNNPFACKQLNHLENRTVALSERIITVTPDLFKKYTKYKIPVSIFPTPAELKNYFTSKFNKKNIPDDIKSISRPVAGFIGTSTVKGKIDWALMELLAKSFPGINFIFIGLYPRGNEHFHKFPNLINLGYKDIKDLPRYVNYFDICLIPYMLNKYGRGAYPVKIMEYLSLGKPVVATDLPSLNFLKKKGLFYTATTHSEFVNKIKLALGSVGKKVIRNRINEAYNYSWNNRILEYIKLITN